MISVENLSKCFVTKAKKSLDSNKVDPRDHGNLFYALKDVSFHCGKGEVLGLLGPNGAGKTTALRILSTALKPDSGQVIVNDVDVLKKPLVAKEKIGFLSGKTGLYGRLTARENIEFFARLHGVNDEFLKNDAERIYENLAITAYLDRRVEHLSTGMQQKVSIARAVIHEPEVVVLDEPTTGLDIMATETIMEFVQYIRSQGTAVIFSTHHLDEIALLADRVSVIFQGNSCFDGTVDDFQQHADDLDLRKAFMNVLREAS
ncbi:ATP-binding cassette domain-containing protein [Thalassotalea sp. HSM 43]|uniref:ABC transporter ATP-binding protein n=1 Tax=Thalassotalea sp. HSM 43 TaxID=2552945 RepID=UPI0010803C49|nr:ATP-binding cassette domain-containing protein [Thalassotalea sp. HSM 43]QBY05831.1 ATP-binding cassette domain-containing protein [Thalassotalea sp. HSM 43]